MQQVDKRGALVVWQEWVKNDNSEGKQKIWRYAYYNSHMDTSLKEKVLKTTLTKLYGMASDEYVLHNCVLWISYMNSRL